MAVDPVAVVLQPVDPERLRLAQRGDPRAFEQLVAPHVAAVRRVAYGFARNWQDADDLAQEALLKAYRSFATYDQRASLSTWLYSVARSTCLDWCRSRLQRARKNEDELLDTEVSAQLRQDELLSQKQNSERLWAAIAMLDPKHRLPLILFEVEGVSYEDIAFIERVPVGTVRSRLSRARGQLRQLLSRLEDRAEHEHVAGAEALPAMLPIRRTT